MGQNIQNPEMNYGEEIENTMIKIIMHDNMTREKREKTNLMKVFIHISKNNDLSNSEVVTCLDGISEFKREIEACDNWIETTRDFATKFYN